MSARDSSAPVFQSERTAPWTPVLQKGKGNILLQEKFLNHTVPGLVQGFVQGEQFQGGACGTGKFSVFKADIQHEAVYIGRRKDGVCLDEKLFRVSRRELEGKVEAQRGPFSFDKSKTERAEFLPARKMLAV